MKHGGRVMPFLLWLPYIFASAMFEMAAEPYLKKAPARAPRPSTRD